MNQHQKDALAARLFADTSRYRDLYDHSRPAPRHWPPAAKERAGQFAPFAALSGYHQLIGQVAARYAHKEYPNGAAERRLAIQLHQLARHLPQMVQLEFFNGATGFYEPLEGQLTAVDWHRQEVVIAAQSQPYRIPIANLRQLRPN